MEVVTERKSHRGGSHEQYSVSSQTILFQRLVTKKSEFQCASGKNSRIWVEYASSMGYTMFYNASMDPIYIIPCLTTYYVPYASSQRDVRFYMLCQFYFKDFDNASNNKWGRKHV